MQPLRLTSSSSEGEDSDDIDTNDQMIHKAEGVEIDNNNEYSAENRDTVIVEAVPTNKAQPRIPVKDGLFSSQARFVARKPWLCFGVAFIIAAVLSIIGLIVGDFQVAADNAGWRTRGL